MYDDHCCTEGLKPGVVSKILPIMGFLIVVAGFSAGVFFTVRQYNKSYENVEYEIYSLDRGVEVEGRFALGSGSINSDIAYYFYVETDRGFELKNLTSSDSSIYLVETDERTPCVVTKKDSKNFQTYKVIYVPIGTVVRSFKG